MPSQPRSECRFLIPLRRDSETSGGEMHTTEAWQWLKEELVERFGGWTVIPGVQGEWKSASSGKTVADESLQFTVAVADESLDEMRTFLRKACVVFAQQCIYLSIAGHVEFLDPA